jgi:glycosyltransferase involved in cell wall biosynthesis
MDTRVILNRVRRARALSLPDLERLKNIQPTLLANGHVPQPVPASLIIPTFHNAGLKNRSLRRVLAGLADSECIREVVLVSSDGTAEDFADLRPLLDGRALQVLTAEPARRGSSRNIGAAAATHDHLVFLDDDMLLKSWRCVDVTLSHLLAEDFECALFPRRHYAKFPLLYDEPALDDVIRQWRQGTELCPSLLLDPAARETRELPLLFCFPGCFMVIRREAYDRLGGFDDRYRGWGLEDTDFGVRALRGLRVLNLLHRAEPLLHIDHAVSPYKSIEAEENLDRFLNGERPVDVMRFCHEVLRGRDLVGAGDDAFRLTDDRDPFAALEAAGIPLNRRELTAWTERIGTARARQMLNPRPDYIALHGSRATGQARNDSDYDVLALYTGAIQEFFVSSTTPRVEVECAELDIFTAVSEQPWSFGLSGVLELAKIANARLLDGDAVRWTAWREATLAAAVGHGHLYWRVLCLGLQANSSKYGQLLPRFLGSLRAVLNAGGLPSMAEELEEFIGADFVRRTAGLLDEARPEWRALLADGQNIFPLQVPEIWSALYALGEVPVAVRDLAPAPQQTASR